MIVKNLSPYISIKEEYCLNSNNKDNGMIVVSEKIGNNLKSEDDNKNDILVNRLKPSNKNKFFYSNNPVIYKAQINKNENIIKNTSKINNKIDLNISSEASSNLNNSNGYLFTYEKKLEAMNKIIDDDNKENIKTKLNDEDSKSSKYSKDNSNNSNNSNSDHIDILDNSNITSLSNKWKNLVNDYKDENSINDSNSDILSKEKIKNKKNNITRKNDTSIFNNSRISIAKNKIKPYYYKRINYLINNNDFFNTTNNNKESSSYNHSLLPFIIIADSDLIKHSIPEILLDIVLFKNQDLLIDGNIGKSSNYLRNNFEVEKYFSLNYYKIAVVCCYKRKSKLAFYYITQSIKSNMIERDYKKKNYLNKEDDDVFIVEVLRWLSLIIYNLLFCNEELKDVNSYTKVLKKLSLMYKRNKKAINNEKNNNNNNNNTTEISNLKHTLERDLKKEINYLENSNIINYLKQRANSNNYNNDRENKDNYNNIEEDTEDIDNGGICGLCSKKEITIETEKNDSKNKGKTILSIDEDVISKLDINRLLELSLNMNNLSNKNNNTHLDSDLNYNMLISQLQITTNSLLDYLLTKSDNENQENQADLRNKKYFEKTIIELSYINLMIVAVIKLYPNPVFFNNAYYKKHSNNNNRVYYYLNIIRKYDKYFSYLAFTHYKAIIDRNDSKNSKYSNYSSDYSHDLKSIASLDSSRPDAMILLVNLLIIDLKFDEALEIISDMYFKLSSYIIDDEVYYTIIINAYIYILIITDNLMQCVAICQKEYILNSNNTYLLYQFCEIISKEYSNDLKSFSYSLLEASSQIIKSDLSLNTTYCLAYTYNIRGKCLEAFEQYILSISDIKLDKDKKAISVEYLMKHKVLYLKYNVLVNLVDGIINDLLIYDINRSDSKNISNLEKSDYDIECIMNIIRKKMNEIFTTSSTSSLININNDDENANNTNTIKNNSIKYQNKQIKSLLEIKIRYIEIRLKAIYSDNHINHNNHSNSNKDPQDNNEIINLNNKIIDDIIKTDKIHFPSIIFILSLIKNNSNTSENSDNSTTKSLLITLKLLYFYFYRSCNSEASSNDLLSILDLFNSTLFKLGFYEESFTISKIISKFSVIKSINKELKESVSEIYNDNSILISDVNIDNDKYKQTIHDFCNIENTSFTLNEIIEEYSKFELWEKISFIVKSDRKLNDFLYNNKTTTNNYSWDYNLKSLCQAIEADCWEAKHEEKLFITMFSGFKKNDTKIEKSSCFENIGDNINGFLLNYANFNKTILELDVLQVISQFNFIFFFSDISILFNISFYNFFYIINSLRSNNDISRNNENSNNLFLNKIDDDVKNKFTHIRKILEIYLLLSNKHLESLVRNKEIIKDYINNNLNEESRRELLYYNGILNTLSTEYLSLSDDLEILRYRIYEFKAILILNVIYKIDNKENLVSETIEKLLLLYNDAIKHEYSECFYTKLFEMRNNH